MIYNKEPILVMWDLVKDLADDIDIYKEIMAEDEDSTPNSYLLLRSQVNDTTSQFGDGSTKIRKADCDFILCTKGTASNSTDLHNLNKQKITNKLSEKGFVFDSYNLGYIESLKSTQHTWSGIINYLIEKKEKENGNK